MLERGGWGLGVYEALGARLGMTLEPLLGSNALYRGGFILA